MSQIFVSYSRVDLEFVRRLAERIQLAFPDLRIWRDDAAHGLIGGDNWWEAILKAVAESDVFVYVLSNESIQSVYCQAEFTEARRLQKRIITIQARDKTELTDELDDIQFVDMKHGPDDPDALQRLNAALNRQLAQAKPMRPLWKPATAKPRKEPPPTRTSDAPTIETPPLQPPTAELEALKLAKSGVRWQIIGVIISVIALLVTILVALPGLIRNDDQPASGATAVVQASDSPSLTPEPPAALSPAVRMTETPSPTETFTPSITPTPTVTLDIALIVGTLDANATIAQATQNAVATIAARATEYALATQAVIDATATATLWTATPTPNITASIEAFRTMQAATNTQAWIDSWTTTPTPTNTNTHTPTFTLTYTPTATFTHTPTNTPILLVYPDTPVTANERWTPITQDFDGMTMVLVPAGCFYMGDDPDAYNLDSTGVPNGGRQCFDEPFWIDQTEVTQADFDRLGGTAGSSSRFTGNDRPVEQITWVEARNFCVLRGGQLPTEAEWEYAARGPSNLLFPWGETWNPSAVLWDRSSSEGTANVGSIPAGASWTGAMDMIGNVWEWTSTLSTDYIDRDVLDNNINTNSARVLRGGSWYDSDPSNLHAASRFNYDPAHRSMYNGFRCARSFDSHALPERITES